MKNGAPTDNRNGMEPKETPTNDPAAAPDAHRLPDAPADHVEPTAPAKSAFGDSMGSGEWAMFLHLSQLAGFLLPGLGFAAPIVIWLLQKTPFPELEVHGKMVTNWMISLLIYSAAAMVLSAVTCGIGVILFVPLMVLAIVFPILGGIKAKDHVLWNYPLTIRFIK